MDLSLFSFSSGNKLPVSDIFCLLVETSVKLSKAANDVNRYEKTMYRTGFFNDIVNPIPYPILEVKNDKGKLQGIQTDPEKIINFLIEKKVMKFSALSPERKKLMQNEINFLNTNFLPVLIQLWYLDLENFNFVVKPNIIEQLNDLNGLQKQFFPRSIRRKILKSYFKKNYTAVEYMKMFRESVSRVSSLLKQSNHFFIFGKEPCLLDAYIFAYFMSLIMPEFENNPYSDLDILKDEKELFHYLKRVKNLIFPVVSAEPISIDKFKGIKAIDEKEVLEIGKNMEHARYWSLGCVTIGVIAMAVFVKFKHKLPFLPFQFLMKKKTQSHRGGFKRK